jgi:hypothetical protein
MHAVRQATWPARQKAYAFFDSSGTFLNAKKGAAESPRATISPAIPFDRIVSSK